MEKSSKFLKIRIHPLRQTGTTGNLRMAVMRATREQDGFAGLTHPRLSTAWKQQRNQTFTGNDAKNLRLCGRAYYATTEMLKPNLWIGQKAYEGLERLPWEDLALAYYGRRLPDALLPAWSELRNANRDLSGIDVLKSYAQASAVLEFSGDKSEIIAIWSAELEDLKGAVESELGMIDLGLDCLAVADRRHVAMEWSVLLAGVYARPDHFGPVVERLNRHGLLSSREDCETVFQQYVTLSSKGIVEPLAANAGPMCVRIFAVVQPDDSR
jgi:hypothetical protein